MARARILPSSQYPHRPPSPPPKPPPKPTKLCKIAVLGDATKSSLVKTFIHRELHEAQPPPDHQPSTTNDGMSTTSSLHSLSLGVTSLPSTASATTSEYASYYKKDVTLLYNSGKDVCVRTQIWDVNLPSILPTNGGGVSHSSFNISNNGNEGHSKLLLTPLLKKCHGFLIVLRAPAPSSTNLSSSTASLGSTSFYSTTNGDWPELDHVELQIIQWVTFLQTELQLLNTTSSITGDNNNDKHNISVALTYGEECIISYSPWNWIELTKRMEGICTKTTTKTTTNNNISWRLCSSSRGEELDSINNDTTTADDDANDRHGFIKRLEREQLRMKEDMMDGMELTFVELIQLFLDGE